MFVSSRSSQASLRPQQRRSRETRERLLRATEEFMDRSPFDSLSIAQICREAGVSVGNFYNRFKDKRALLQALYISHEERRTETADAHLDPGEWEGLDLSGRVRKIVEAFVAYYSDRPGLIRSFILHHRTHPDEVPPSTRDALTGIYERATERLAGDGAGITHPDGPGACRFAIFILAAACRERIVFASDPQAVFARAQQARLMTELYRLVYGYLRTGADGRPAPACAHPPEGCSSDSPHADPDGPDGQQGRTA